MMRFNRSAGTFHIRAEARIASSSPFCQASISTRAVHAAGRRREGYRVYARKSAWAIRLRHPEPDEFAREQVVVYTCGDGGWLCDRWRLADWRRRGDLPRPCIADHILPCIWALLATCSRVGSICASVSTEQIVV